MNRLQFNIAGPCVPNEHYIISPFRDINNELISLINGKNYFVIHAARQTGKTTLLKELIRKINSEGKYYALYCSLEALQAFVNPEKAIPEIVKKIQSNIKNQELPKGYAENADYTNISDVIKDSLIQYCKKIKKPLVIFFDEADCLANGTLITFLRQLREGYINRGDTPFVHSIALVGMRNIRDYKASIRSDLETLGSASPFNIITKSLNLRNFTKDEVVALYKQHTRETGQIFETEAIDYVFEQTLGQPWLVNAIARECVVEILKENYSISVTKALIIQAIQNLIQDRGTHFDSMMYRLKDPRVKNIILPLLIGEKIFNKSIDDFLYTRDLGIIRENDDGSIEHGNPIYGDMIIRTLNWDIQQVIKQEYSDYNIPRYIKDGQLDMGFLIKDFQEFWRENSTIWKKCLEEDLYIYEEAAAHLVLYAFLQRVINGGGQIIREKSAGKKRIDLYISFKDQRYPIELKILQNEKSRDESYNQLLGYMDTLGSDSGWLVIFDKDTEKSWDEKIFMNSEIINGKSITVAGC